MNEELLENDPVLAAIRAEMQRMLADTSFKPGPPKKKAHKVIALAPDIRALRAKGYTWRQIAETFESKGLVVTVKTVREVMRELDGPSQRGESNGVAQIAATPSKTKTGTAQRKSRGTTKRKSAAKSAGKSSAKSQRTPRADAANVTGEGHAHANGRVNGTARNVGAELGAPLASNNSTEGSAVHDRGGESQQTAAAALSAASEVSANLPTPTAATPKPKRRFGAKGIEY